MNALLHANLSEEHNQGVQDSRRFAGMLDSAKRNGTGRAPSFFKGLSEGEIETILHACKQRVLYRGAKLFSQGGRQDGIYLVETGRIRVYYIGPSGRELTLAYWHPGNFVGGPDVFGNGTHVWSGTAAMNSSVYHLPGEALRELMMRIPTLAVTIVEGLSFKGRCYSALAQMLGTLSPNERFAHLMLHLIDLYGVEEAQGIVIAAPFTHADISHMVGVTRQWVSSTFKRYAELGIIDPYGPHIVIKDADALKDNRNQL